MERKDFLKKVALAGVSVSMLAGRAIEQGTPVKCDETSEGEEGPFPTKAPSSLPSKSIVLDRAGTPLTISIFVNNINDKCNALKGAIVDLWHCDHLGEYSEYGRGLGDGKDFPMPPPANQDRKEFKDDRNRQGPPSMGGGGMQEANNTNEHFLRGRQTTNANGVASFTSIFPGWYPGRAPHIHAHIYDKNEKSLLICQIAFPDDVSKEVHGQGVYKDHEQADTSNISDHVFNDSIANELAIVTGNPKDGYLLTHSIYVKA